MPVFADNAKIEKRELQKSFNHKRLQTKMPEKARQCLHFVFESGCDVAQSDPRQ